MIKSSLEQPNESKQYFELKNNMKEIHDNFNLNNSSVRILPKNNIASQTNSEPSVSSVPASEMKMNWQLLQSQILSNSGLPTRLKTSSGNKISHDDIRKKLMEQHNWKFSSNSTIQQRMPLLYNQRRPRLKMTPPGEHRPRSTQLAPPTFFRSAVNMMAAVEGGILAPDHAEFDQAVNDALYGIYINGDCRLVYDKLTGPELIKWMT